MEGSDRIVKILIENGASITLKNGEGEKPIDVTNNKDVYNFLKVFMK
jgi:hypothetical protein